MGTGALLCTVQNTEKVLGGSPTVDWHSTERAAGD